MRGAKALRGLALARAAARPRRSPPAVGGSGVHAGLGNPAAELVPASPLLAMRVTPLCTSFPCVA